MAIHPAILIFFSSIMFLFLVIYSNPLVLLSIAIFLIAIGIQLDKKEELIQLLRWSGITMAFIILINPIVSNVGNTVLIRINHVFIIGQIKITLESILYGINMGIKFLSISLLFFCYGILVDQDDAFTFFSKYFSKLTLTVSMTVNIIHRLRLEIIRVKDVMILRGVSFDEKNLIKRMKAYYSLIKVIFITALEGSFNRAEALEARKYGKYKRTSYKENKIRKKDYRFLFITILLLLFGSLGIIFDLGKFNFYPRLSTIKEYDIYFIIGLNCLLFLYFMLIRSGSYESN